MQYSQTDVSQIFLSLHKGYLKDQEKLLRNNKCLHLGRLIVVIFYKRHNVGLRSIYALIFGSRMCTF